MNKIIAILLLLLAVPAISLAEDSRIPPECEIIIDDFADGIKPGWTPKSFKGKTEYIWTVEDGKPFIKATSNNAASGLIYKIKYDPQKYPYITWSWKADNIIASGDATRKSKDDYSARIYVAFPALFFWNTKIINYIWANKLPQNQFIPSSYASNSIMVGVESGPANTGRWITETRNVYEDYIRFFGKKPPKVGAIAIMTDTDNTGESTSASYGPISICSRDPRSLSENSKSTTDKR
jgi:hypothetical protein